MSLKGRVLIVDDQPYEIEWLVDHIGARGFEIDLATNKAAADDLIRRIPSGEKSYKWAIFDVMVAIKNLHDLAQLDDDFFEESRNAGIDLCRLAREELDISATDLPIVCLTVREDDELKQALKELDIPLYSRAGLLDREDAIDKFLDEWLPQVEADPRRGAPE